MSVAYDRDRIVPDMGVEALARGQHGDPFSILGPHRVGKDWELRVFAPDTDRVEVIDRGKGETLTELERGKVEGFFSGKVAGLAGADGYRLRFHAGEHVWESEDPYRFPPILGDVDLHLIGEGRHQDLYRVLGAHPRTMEGVPGVAFVVWAPNAERVSVVGSFNAWDGRRHPMRRRLEGGVWELFIPGLAPGDLYKYEILGIGGALQPLKADPMSFSQELPPSTASRVYGLPEHEWHDGEWLSRREAAQDPSAPISIYECHLGSWRRGEGGAILDYDGLADQLVPYVERMGFTHVEFMPVSEHPFGGSWGYQPIGLYAPTRRFGSPEGFARLVDRFHRAGIGVIIDWVPAHFPTDAHGLVRFDGTALYEHEDPRRGFHRDWNTLIYNMGRNEVSNFLQANATYWIERFHVDALRVDAVASMLYLDYSREAGDWIPNEHGGRENLESIRFLREMNELVDARSEGATTMAEESTAWPGVSRPTSEGGLGFGYKWNMGWMHDTLDYFSRDPLYRSHHQDQLTFGLIYAFSEKFILPISHDEVVYGKGSMLTKMPGDRWQQFANLRAYYGFMWTQPGKKLLFMGTEFGQEREWNHDGELDWHLLGDRGHEGVQALVRDLNRLYRDVPALHELDCDPKGFEWVDASDAANSILSYLRLDAEGSPVLVVCNLTPRVHEDYSVGVPQAGAWREILNTDAGIYGGSNIGNGGAVETRAEPIHGRPASLPLTLPPLATLILKPDGRSA